MTIKRFIGISTYNRSNQIGSIVESILSTAPNGTTIAVADDGSTDDTANEVKKFPVLYLRGKNKGVGVNKNRLLFLGQSAHLLVILEDDLSPTAPSWFEDYEKAAVLTNNHHFCRVQNREVIETVPSFSTYLQQTVGLTPIYGNTPRGDLTFLTKSTITNVGGFNSEFKGAGYAHGNWSRRVQRAGLIAHPLAWWDIKEARDKFIQIGDTSGGRWDEDEEKIRQQIKTNRNVSKRLDQTNYIYHPLVLE